MKTYPQIIDLSKYAGISDEEIRRDIADTEREIEQFEKLQVANQIEADNHPDEHMRHVAQFKADARPHQQAERRDFVAFLQRILAARERAAGVPA